MKVKQRCCNFSFECYELKLHQAIFVFLTSPDLQNCVKDGYLTLLYLVDKFNAHIMLNNSIYYTFLLMDHEVLVMHASL